MSEITKPFGYSIFCDDIRHEIGGKISVIGVYSDALIFAQAPPVVYSQLHLVAFYVEPEGYTENSVDLIVLRSGSEEPIFRAKVIDAGERDAEPPRTQSGGQLVNQLRFTAQLPPLAFSEPGDLRVRFVVGDELIRAGSLDVYFEEETKAPK